MVELALVFPLFLGLFLLVVQGGITFHNYIALTDAVREGARVAAVSRRHSDRVERTQEAVQRGAANLSIPAGDIAVDSSWEHGDDVTVTATYPFEIDLLGILPEVLALEGTLTSATTERVE